MIHAIEALPSGVIIRAGSHAIDDVTDLPVDDGNVLLVVDQPPMIDYALDYLDVTLKPPVIRKRSLIGYTLNKAAIDADGIDLAIISGLPTECVAILESETYEATEGEFQFATDLPGAYEITLRSPLFLDTIVEVTAKWPQSN